MLAAAGQADTLRVATYNTELSRKGPGLLLRDILKGQDDQIDAVAAQIATADADIIALQGVDYDLELRALTALAQTLRTQGTAYPYLYAAPPNAGRMTDFDLDGDGRKGGPADAQGYGRFFGQGSMALLSRLPLRGDAARDYSELLWLDLPDPLLPETDDGSPFPSVEALAAQRLFSHGAWSVTAVHPSYGEITLMAYHATPPVFDGPEDKNGKRNHDETMFWVHLLDGRMGPAPMAPFVLLGDANLDPDSGDGLGGAMARLLAHPALQDPLPGQPTVSFSRTGPLRVDYVLPSADWRIVDAGILAADPKASRHGLVWVDLAR